MLNVNYEKIMIYDLKKNSKHIFLHEIILCAQKPWEMSMKIFYFFFTRKLYLPILFFLEQTEGSIPDSEFDQSTVT